MGRNCSSHVDQTTRSITSLVLVSSEYNALIFGFSDDWCSSRSVALSWLLGWVYICSESCHVRWYVDSFVYLALFWIIRILARANDHLVQA